MQDTIKAIELLRSLEFCPSAEAGKGGKVHASNNEKKRLLEQGAVTINGCKPKPQDEVTLPVTECVFFKGKPRQVTLV